MGEISVNIYADEQTNLKYDGHNFLGIATLFIPEKQKPQVIRDLLNLRCLNKANHSGWHWEYENCPFKDLCNIKYHTYNNMEIHYNDLKSQYYSHREISKRWLRYFINKNLNGSPIPFNILYIDLTNLDIDVFGVEKWHLNVYNRFFRSNLKFALKTFFLNEYDRVIVKNIFHDKSDGLQSHPYFSVKNPKKIEAELNKTLPSWKRIELPQKVIFVDSNHKEEKVFKEDSQLIQLTDLVLGTISQNIFYTAKTEPLKKELAMIIRPVLEEFFENPYRGLYYKRNISFFPKKPLEHAKQIFQTLDGSIQVEFKRNLFYRDITFKMPKFQKTTLDSWLK